MSAPLPAYTIERLAPGSYDILIDSSLVAALVRDVDRNGAMREWVLNLLDETSATMRPAPFTAQRRAFGSLAAALASLGIHERGIADALGG